MPSRLKRLHDSRQTHFITFSCYHRRRLLTEPDSARTFELALERVRVCYGLRVYGYVVMPDHVHLLLSEPDKSCLSEAVKALKQGVSRRLRPEDGHFWQTRYYDFNIRDHGQLIEKLRYIHRNPVTAGLCARPEDWPWSSFVHYATESTGAVEIESEWTARKREPAKHGASLSPYGPPASEDYNLCR